MRILIIIYGILWFMRYIYGDVVDYYWRDYNGEVPKDAYEGATGLFIGQMPCNGVLPATIYPNKEKSVSECNGKKVEMKDGVKIFCCEHKEHFHWEYVNVKQLNSQKLSQLVKGGLENGYTLYIGKVFHEGDWKIGKVFPPASPLQGLRIWYNEGPEYVTSDFQVLVYDTGRKQKKSAYFNYDQT